jgi:hypothetical protein
MMTEYEELHACMSLLNQIAAEPTATRASNSDVEHLQVPFTLYSTDTDDSGKWMVYKLRVVRYGVNHEAGASSPSITFVYSDHPPAHFQLSSARHLGSVHNYYLTREDAQCEATYNNACEQQEFLEKKFNTLAKKLLPRLLDHYFMSKVS